MNQINKLILTKLKLEFEMNVDEEPRKDFWILATSVIPFDETPAHAPFLPYIPKGSERYKEREV